MSREEKRRLDWRRRHENSYKYSSCKLEAEETELWNTSSYIQEFQKESFVHESHGLSVALSDYVSCSDQYISWKTVNIKGAFTRNEIQPVTEIRADISLYWRTEFRCKWINRPFILIIVLA